MFSIGRMAVRYVGKGKGLRVENNSRKTHNPHVAKLIELAGGQIPYKKILEDISEEEAFELECFLIREIGRGAKGPLLNLTAGGDGVSGYIQTPEHLAKLSAVRRGRSLSPEARQLISEKLKGRTFSNEHKAAISSAKKGKSQGPLSEDHIAAIVKANTGGVDSAKLDAILAKCDCHLCRHRYGGKEMKWLPTSNCKRSFALHDVLLMR